MDANYSTPSSKYNMYKFRKLYERAFYPKSVNRIAFGFYLLLKRIFITYVRQPKCHYIDIFLTFTEMYYF